MAGLSCERFPSCTSLLPSRDSFCMVKEVKIVEISNIDLSMF